MNLRTTFQGGLATFVAAAFLYSVPLTSKTVDEEKEEQRGKKGETEQTGEAQPSKGATILRVPTQAFESIKNKVSRVEFYSTNYGIFGLNVAANQAGGIWPRGSGKAYIFGGGIWFGAEKVRNGDTNKLSVIGYNPNSGASWMVPGVIEGPLDENKLDQSPAAVSKYRLYFSSDYDNFTGEPLDQADREGPNWPIWDTKAGDTLRQNRYFGEYIDDLSRRNLATYPKGPAIVSGEDIFSVYKDTDVKRYREISPDTARKKGYPIGIQVEQTIYTWGFGRYGDFIFLKYNIINKSGENLLNCYMAPALDMDIGAAANDRARIFIDDAAQDTLNLAVQWSEAEASGQFGYIGFDFLESPAVDPATGFIRNDQKVYTESEQIGLTTFQAWKIEEDPKTPEQRYNFMAARDRDLDVGPGDQRFLTATGPFNMAPGDTARVVVGVMFAFGRSAVPTGTEEDMKPLWELDTFAQSVYNNNFAAPKPPEPANVSWQPLDNGVELNWDETSERSLDRLERGLDFLGYIIRRSRRVVGTGFQSNDSITGWNVGWKTIGGFVMPDMPDSLTRVVAARRNDPSILGAWWRLPMLLDTVAGTPAQFYVVRCIDTLRRPGKPDSLITSNDSCGVSVRNVRFAFDPYDDNNDDSSAYNGRDFGPAFGDMFKNKATRDIVRDAITAIMDSITNNRTFVDVGDDNNDGQITENPVDLSQNEKLINNIDYYYQVLAYDAGSAEGTPSKTNSGVAGVNEVRATPAAPPAGPPVKPVIVSSSGLGGIHNFNLIVYNDERLGQLFGGDTLDFIFDPVDPLAYGFLQLYYGTEISVVSRRTGKEIMRFVTNYDNQFADRADTVPGEQLLDSAFQTRWVDSLTRFVARNMAVPYNGTFVANSLQPTYGTVGVYKGTFAVTFDYSFLQFGDSLRFGVLGDSTFKASPFTTQYGSGANTNLGTGKVSLGQLAANRRTAVLNHYPSIGQAKIQVEFLPGGTETIRVKKGADSFFVDVNYLNVRVKNVASYKRTIYRADGTRVDTTITYDYEFPADQQMRLSADTTNAGIDIARTVEPGDYALYAYGWIGSDTLPFGTRVYPFQRSRYYVGSIGSHASYLGTPGRYYVGSYSTPLGGNLRFTHKLVVNGAEIFIDYAGMGTNTTTPDSADVPATVPTQDVQPGDKFVVDFTGGALGLPSPGAKVSVAIPEVKPELSSYTDEALDEITIVPNPYLVTHIGQPANVDRRLYITRLPEKCTVQIYTESGELLQTIEHDVTGLGVTEAKLPVEVWDLLTRTNRLAQSQLLIFRISTPNGAETIKKAAVVVGGYRILSR